MAGSIRKRQWQDRQGKLKNAWFVDYYDKAGHRQRQQFTTKRMAEERLRQIANELHAGVHTPDAASVTVTEAARQWLQQAQRNSLERGSRRAYEQLVRLGIEPLLGKIKLSRLSAPQVEAFANDLLDRFSHQRSRRILSTLSSVLTHATRHGLVAQNVARDVRIDPRARLQDKLDVGRNVPSLDEVRRLLAAAAAKQGRLAWLHPMVLLAAYSGLREGELRGLMWGDIDFAAARLQVCRRADQWGDFGPPKSAAGQRVVVLAPLVVTELRRWRLACGHPELVFRGPRADSGKVISQSGVMRAFAELQCQAGIAAPAPDGTIKAKYVFHSLRHFCASLLISLGYSTKALQTMLGHENVTLTLGTYGHLIEGAEDNTGRILAMQRLLSGEPAA